MKKLNVPENITKKLKTMILREGKNYISENCKKANENFKNLKISIDECMNKFNNNNFLSEVPFRRNRL